MNSRQRYQPFSAANNSSISYEEYICAHIAKLIQDDF